MTAGKKHRTRTMTGTRMGRRYRSVHADAISGAGTDTGTGGRPLSNDRHRPD